LFASGRNSFVFRVCFRVCLLSFLLCFIIIAFSLSLYFLLVFVSFTSSHPLSKSSLHATLFWFWIILHDHETTIDDGSFPAFIAEHCQDYDSF